MTHSLIHKLHTYQKERFPLLALAASFVPAILSSAAVLGALPLPVPQALLALLAAIAYLFHIRVIDEHRDFEHDNVHHPERPVQRGAISKKELARADFVAVAALLAVAASLGAFALLLALLMLLYTHIAGKEFYMGERIRRRFFLYNAVNVGQMLLLQIFIYACLAGAAAPTMLLALHFIATSVGTVTYEFMRKIKLPHEEGSGKDTYTWHLGLRNALIAFAGLLGLLGALYAFLAYRMSGGLSFPLAIAALAAAALITVALHERRKHRHTGTLMQASAALAYGCFNILIYALTFF